MGGRGAFDICTSLLHSFGGVFVPSWYLLFNCVGMFFAFAWHCLVLVFVSYGVGTNFLFFGIWLVSCDSCTHLFDTCICLASGWYRFCIGYVLGFNYLLALGFHVVVFVLCLYLFGIALISFLYSWALSYLLLFQ